MKICAAIVTYGNRFHLLKEVLSYCIKEQIDKIIIIDNGSSLETKSGLKLFIEQNKKPIKVVDLHLNTGSANGFKEAILNAAKQYEDFIFILDDDNVPEKGALDLLKKEWTNKVSNSNSEDLIILANRIDRSNFKKVLKTHNAEHILPYKNNFIGFHWKEFGDKFRERIFKTKNNSLKNQIVEVIAAPYSGMLFHKSLVSKYGLPNKDYYLYQDDFEYTYKFHLQGGKIWLVENAIINDLESSIYLPKKKKILYHSLFDGSEIPMYYAFRNMHYFTKKYRVNNSFLLGINRISFWSIISIMGLLTGNLKKLKLLRHAIYDAENNILGKNSKYILK